MILWCNSAFITQIQIMYYNEHNRRYVLHHGRFPLLQPRKGLTNTCIQYRWDCIAWCVGVIFQHEGSTPRVISLYHIMTPHKSVWGGGGGASYNVKWALLGLFYCNVLHIGRFPLHQPRKGLTNTCILYRWDRIAWCVGVIFQHEGSTPRVISLYHITTPHKNVGGGGGRITWNEHSWGYLIKIWYLCHRCHRFPWPTEDIMQLKTRASGVMSLYIRISPHGSE